jgi:hypothetical protein
MDLAIFRKTIWVILTPLALILTGCGAGNKATVTGKVTLGGKAVETGFVTFFPEDNRGSPITVEIVQGQYTIEDLVPGKKRIYVNVTERVESGPDETATSRRESNAERLAGSKKRQTLSKQPAPAKIDGNNKIVTIGSGSQQIDIPLEKHTGK